MRKRGEEEERDERIVLRSRDEQRPGESGVPESHRNALHQEELQVWKEGRGERKREVDDDGEAHSRSRRDVCVRLDVTEKRRTQVLRERLFQVWRDDEEGDAG